MATHSSVLAWKIPETGETGGLPSVGLHEGKFLKPQKNLPLDNSENSSVGSVSMSSGSRGAMLDSEPRPVERGGAGRMTGGVKDQIGLVARNHILEAKG